MNQEFASNFYTISDEIELVHELIDVLLLFMDEIMLIVMQRHHCARIVVNRKLIVSWQYPTITPAKMLTSNDATTIYSSSMYPQ